MPMFDKSASVHMHRRQRTVTILFIMSERPGENGTPWFQACVSSGACLICAGVFNLSTTAKGKCLSGIM